MGIAKRICLQGECQLATPIPPEDDAGEELGLPLCPQKNTERMRKDQRITWFCGKKDGVTVGPRTKDTARGKLSLLDDRS